MNKKLEPVFVRARERAHLLPPELPIPAPRLLPSLPPGPELRLNYGRQ